MAAETQLDVRFFSTDESIIKQLETSLIKLKPERLDEHRNVETIITITAAAVALVSQLIDLWKKLKQLEDPPIVEVEAESGIVINLIAVKPEDIEQFVLNNEGSGKDKILR